MSQEQLLSRCCAKTALRLVPRSLTRQSARPAMYGSGPPQCCTSRLSLHVVLLRYWFCPITTSQSRILP